MSSNGKPQAPPDLALRPSLDDVRDRQRAVLQQLDHPIPPADVMRFKYDVVEACVGRIPPGLRRILAEPHLSALNHSFYSGTDTASQEFRYQLAEMLSVVFAYPLEDMSRISNEQFPRQGITPGNLTPTVRATEYR